MKGYFDRLDQHERAEGLFGLSLATPIGCLFAMADADHLLYLNFLEQQQIDAAVSGLKLQAGTPRPLISIQEELQRYFSGDLRQFHTPYKVTGSAFQLAVWQGLIQIPYGTTLSYKEEASQLGRPRAVRAVANANGANPLAIVIPCHRVIQSDGRLGGYSGGLDKKEWLLAHERENR